LSIFEFRVCLTPVVIDAPFLGCFLDSMAAAAAFSARAAEAFFSAAAPAAFFSAAAAFSAVSPAAVFSAAAASFCLGWLFLAGFSATDDFWELLAG
jgi:hypothetical protein